MNSVKLWRRIIPHEGVARWLLTLLIIVLFFGDLLPLAIEPRHE